MEVGTTNEILSIVEKNFGGKSAPEPIPDPVISVGTGVLLASAIMLLVSSVEVEAAVVEVGIDLLG